MHLLAKFLKKRLNSRLLFIEFSPEIMTGLVMYDKIEVGKSRYNLKGLVRCQQSHFTCAISSEDRWLFFDDLVQTVKTFPTFEATQRQIPIGWFFCSF